MGNSRTHNFLAEFLAMADCFMGAPKGRLLHIFGCREFLFIWEYYQSDYMEGGFWEKNNNDRIKMCILIFSNKFLKEKFNTYPTRVRLQNLHGHAFISA